MPSLNRLTAVVASVALAAGLLAAGHPPAQAADPIYLDPTQPVPARVADLLGRMSLEEKLGQMTMRDVKYPPVGPEAARDQLLGSLLSGGDSAPDPNTATSWADRYDRYQDAARQTRLGIPLLYGVDAVHGHAGVYGATVFPHNVGLGATRDAALVERIGRATATEVAATGVDWTFSPCVCVARDDHWGRVYESFGETPENPSAMTSLITGLQGTSLADKRSIMATAKHYVGDGGTLGGIDRGDTVGDDAALRKIHLPPFEEAVKRNVASVMVSYSSWNGKKMHGNEDLIRDHLRKAKSAGGLGFDGIVITDWDGAEKVDGEIKYTETDVSRAVTAGIDIFMVTDQYGDYIKVFRNVVAANPAVMHPRIDDSVRRILTKKFEKGLFERRYADRELLSEVGSAAHRAIAREAVQKSQVVLKNNGVLPLRNLAGKKVFVAGKSADNIGFQSGGWTINWQGGDGAITPGTSILQGIRNSAGPGTTVTYDKKGDGVDSSYAAAIAVVGEQPYAEDQGDRKDHELGLDSADKAVLANLKKAGVPVVTVLVSGRPLLVTDELPDMSALVASWLPGSEGQGVGDVLFGAVRPTGKLPVSWPSSAAQQPINSGDGKTPLFAYGHGLTYDPVTTLPEQPEPAGRSARDTLRAESYNGQFGTQLEQCSDPGCGNAVSYVSPGDRLYLDDVDFGSTSPTTVTTRVASGGSSGTIEFRLDRVAGPVVATASITPTGGWTAWKDVTAAVSTVTGKHRLYLTFTGPGGDFVNVNWFRFA